MKLKAHPRLWPNPETLITKPESDLATKLARQVRRDAKRFAEMPPLEYPRNTHNEHLVRAREVQTRVFALLAEWERTGQKKYRSAVMKNVRMMGKWRHWSWIAWQAGEDDPSWIYDLSCGENSTTLAVAYDWLYKTLSPAEKKLFVHIARTRSFKPAMKFTNPAKGRKTRRGWWFKHPEHNWNTVCTGGFGMLALAMYDDAPEAPELLKRAQQSITPYMKHLDETAGAWPEGVGYWNYGMRYGFMYLLCHERATGKPHPLMKLKGVAQTQQFPLDFCPHGTAAGFGDANGFTASPFHYAMARRLGLDVTANELLIRLAETGPGKAWPTSTWLHTLPADAQPRRSRKTEKNIAKLYDNVLWGILADRMPGPNLYVSVRGGHTRDGHSNADLMSFNLVAGKEPMISTIQPSQYVDATFSPRRFDIYEFSALAKNTILINGVGTVPRSELDRTELISGRGWRGIRMVATSAMGPSRAGPAADFCGRAVIMLNNNCVVVVDRGKLPHAGYLESRMHTHAKTSVRGNRVSIRGKHESLEAVYSCNVPAMLVTGETIHTIPTTPKATVLRWCTAKQHKDIVMVTCLCPGKGRPAVELDYGRQIKVTVRHKGKTKTIRLTRQLRPGRQRTQRGGTF